MLRRSTPLLFVVMLATLFSGPVAPARAERPAPTATSFERLTHPVAAGDRLVLACGSDAGRHSPWSAVVMLTVERADGSQSFSAALPYAPWPETSAGARAGDVEITHRSDDDELDAPGFLVVQGYPPLEEGGTLRAARARWGAGSDCEVFHHRDGALVLLDAWSALDTERARLVTDDEFGPAARVGAQGCHDVTRCVGAGAAVADEYRHRTDGLVYSLFFPTGPWVGSIERPDGTAEAYDPARCAGSGVSTGVGCPALSVGRAHGTWTYRVDAGASDRVGPVLWILDVPGA